MYRKNIYLFDYPKEVVIEKKILSSLQVLNTDKKFLDINEEIFSVKYDCQICRDIVQHMYKTMALSYNIPLEQIMSRYSDTYEDVEERIMFRIELYKHGWSIEQIENYIFQYLLKQEFKIDNIDRVYKKYHNFMVKRDIINKEMAKKVGRPSLPKVLKQYLKMKHLENVKLLMRDKYESSKN